MKFFRVFSLAAILLICAASIFATAQFPDKIFYKNTEYKLHSNPMEEYFKKFPEKKPKGGIISSALWRGYVATFEISENTLYLKDIEIEVQKKSTNEKSFETEWKSVLAEVTSGNRIKIEWFTGLLVLPHGKIVNYVHMGYGSTYENYILLEIDKGEFKRAKEFDYKTYEAFKERQFEAFKKTDEYKKLLEVEKKRDKNFDVKFFDSFLRSYITNYTSQILVE